MTSRKWGSQDGGPAVSTDAATVIRASGVYPCLDVLFPGKLRTHCAKCTEDAGINQFSRKRASFIAVREMGSDVDKFVRIRYHHAEQLAKGLVTDKIRFGQLLFIRNDVLESNASLTVPAADIMIKTLADSRADIACTLVSGNYTVFEEGQRYFLIQGNRASPYLIMYHEGSVVSQWDILAFSEKYSAHVMKHISDEYDAEVDAGNSKI